MYSLVFNRSKKLNREGKGLIQIEVYMNKRRKYFSTKVYIKINQWDSIRRQVKNHSNSKSLNEYLTQCISELEEIELNTIKHGKTFTFNDFKKKDEKVGISFLIFMEKEIGQADFKESTTKNHISTLNILHDYKKEIYFQDLTYEFLCDFEHFLLTRLYNRNTISKHMKHIKRYLNLAINKNMFEMQDDPFRKYKMKYQESKRTHLTPEEVTRIESLDLQNKKYLEKCRDLFLFSCYTGLRFSDVIRITDENFHLIDNHMWLIYSSLKTNINVRLPLSLLFDGKAISIYKKYRQKEHTLFNVSILGNSNINKQLEKICILASIKKKVSFHAARHTNATLLLYNGANITTVQKLLGHKNVQTTQIYSNIMDMTIIRDLQKIGKKWTK